MTPKLKLGSKLGDMPVCLQNFWKRDFPIMYTFGSNLDLLERKYGARILWDYKEVEFPDEESYVRFQLEWS